MIRRSILVFYVATFAFAPNVALAAIDPNAWETRQSMVLSAGGPARVALPAELLDAARADLADLRVLGPDGSEVPFVVLRHQPKAAARSESVAVTPRLDGNKTVIEFTLPAARGVTRLQLLTPATEFVKAITLETRRDSGSEWKTIARDLVVFRARARAENLALALDGADAQSFRLTIDDARAQPVPFTDIVIQWMTMSEPPPAMVPATISAIDSAAGETRLALDLGLGHRHLAALTFAVRDAAFERSVRLVARAIVDGGEVSEQTLASGTIRRLALPGGFSFSDLVLAVDQVTPSAQLELVIDNGDSPPLTIESVTAGVWPVHVALQATAAGNHMLLVGNAIAVAPRYDVAAFAQQWARLSAAELKFGSLERNPAYRPTEPTPEVPEFAGPFDATGWRNHRVVSITESGAQVLELDAAVLAATRGDLGELRLVRGGRQVPFLLERSTRQRSLPLTLVAASDAKRPQVGRWTIDLPFIIAPFTRLTFEVNEPLFERRAMLIDAQADAQPDLNQFYHFRHVLGVAVWVRRSASDPGKFFIELTRAPSTRQLVLEIDHGDNQPFAPMSVEGAYPVRRLRFRATTPAQIELYYGHATATAPRYDIQLAAPRLLAAREHTATLAGSGTAGTQVEREEFSIGHGWGRIAFWGSLAIVVVVLVWVVAKLLPKPPAA